MTDTDTADDPDPIQMSYDVYIKPHISEDRQIFILQFPNRDSRQHYSESNDARPFKMRVKEKIGMVELDVPVDAWRNYDREKGVKWGEAMRRSNMAKGGGSHGLPGGFGIGGAAPGGRGRGRGEEENTASDLLLADYAGAIQREQVLVKQTLGGQFVSNDDTTPQYMTGVFRGDQLHLAPVNRIVQMRPQFHHIDAQNEQERVGRGREREAGVPALAQARAIHMTVKSSIDGEESTTDTMGQRITAAQAEIWKSHKYVDEEDDEAWESFAENLFVGAELKIEDSAELKAKMPVLKTSLDNEEYMDFISAPTNPAKLSISKKVRVVKRTGKGKENEGIEGVDSDFSSTESSAQSESETHI